MQARIEAEWETVDLGDVRRNRRARLVGTRWAAAPGASFPSMMASDAELAGFYGLVENEEVDPRELHAAHARASLARIDEAAFGREVLVIADTTSFEFPGNGVRRDLGWITHKTQGFHAHFALALAADGSATPFGVIGVSTFMRERPDPDGTQRTRDGKKLIADPKRESLRWSALADETSELLRGHAIPIHVTDRESDTYEYVSGRIAGGQRFVLRARELHRPVSVIGEEVAVTTRLHLVAEAAVPLVGREARLTARGRSPYPKGRKKHPPRTTRVARLEFACERVRIPRPKHLPNEMLPFVEVNIVYVRESDSPEDAEPVEWLLITTEPIANGADVLRIVDFYRARWTIEEFHKALKTGCQFESRQLEDAQALLIALAICVPIAWQMLALRQQSRTFPEQPATTILSKRRIDTLRTIARKPLPTSPTVLDACLAIAALGGHIARNGPPGWQTLRKGLDHLLIVEEAFAARDAAEKAGSARSGQ
jgi:hypothetical protein